MAGRLTRESLNKLTHDKRTSHLKCQPITVARATPNANPYPESDEQVQVAIYGEHVILDRPAAEWLHGMGVAPEAIRVQGRATYALPHNFDAVRLFRNVGVELPTKIKTDGYEFPGRFKPYAHQLDTADFLAGYERAFCLSDPGVGKTASAIWAADYLMNAGVIRRALVLCPLSCVESVWADELFGIAPHQPSAMLTGPKATRLKMLASPARWLVVNHDGIKTIEKELASPESQIDLVIVDECFVAGTLVHTPAGKVGIETLKAGDEVLTSSGTQRIRFTSSRDAETVRVTLNTGETLVCTPEHPFFTDVGWVRAADLVGRRLIDDAALRSMRGRVSGVIEPLAVGSGEQQQHDENLLSILRAEEVAHGQSGGELLHEHAAPRTGLQLGVSILGSPPSGDVGSGESTRSAPRVARRKRDRGNSGRGFVPRGATRAVGVELPGSVGPEAARLSYELQARLCEPGLPSRLGAGRRDASYAVSKGAGHQERTAVSRYGLASVSSVERRGVRRVFNLDVEGTPNYFVGAGFLVHNCTAFKSENSDRSKALKKVVADRRVWAMTGTPIPQNPIDAYFLCKLMNKDAPQFKYQFQDQTMRKVTKFKWVPKAEAPDVIFKYMTPAVRYKKSDCLDMPEIVRSVRAVPMTPEQRTIIDAIKKDWTTTVGGQEITAANAAVQVGKILQVLQGAVISADGTAVPVDAAPRRQACLDAIRESASKTVVFATYKAAIRELYAFLLLHGVTVGVIDGDVSLSERTGIINDFQNLRDPQVILAHPKTASHGITLTAASTTVWYGPTYSGELFEQANNRTDRPGQKQDMRIIMLSSGADESAIYKGLHERANVQQMLLDMYKRDTGAI